jgi:isoleucyl-tRNA synthetase
MLHRLAELDRHRARRPMPSSTTSASSPALSAFMNTDLSAFYFDIRKDALYCDPYSSVARKACLTVHRSCSVARVKWLAPMLSLHRGGGMARDDPAATSEHLGAFPAVPEGLARRCAGREMARSPQRAPRRDRRAGTRTRGKTHRLLAGSGADRLCLGPELFSNRCSIVDLAEVCITSEYDGRPGEDRPRPSGLTTCPASPSSRAAPKARKCARSWKILADRRFRSASIPM